MKAAYFEPSTGLMRGLRITAGAGALVFAAGLYFAPERTWVAFLVAFVLFTGLALCGPLFSSLLVLSKARWPGELRRIPEATLSSLVVAALLGVVLISGVYTLYEWSHPATVASDPLLQHKAPYLNLVGFAARMGVYFVSWVWLAGNLLRATREMRAQPGPVASRRATRAAALFMSVFAITFSLASIDWVQSRAPHWFSTIFALITLSTIALAGCAAFILLAAAVDARLHRAQLLPPERVDDLGRILIGLSLFWAYIGYCQHALIWYTNMPEETAWYEARSGPEWVIVARAVLVLCWLTPFLVLMPRRLRRSRTALTRTAVAVLVGSIGHLYYLVMPTDGVSAPTVGLWEIALPAAALAGFAWCAFRELGRRFEMSHGPEMFAPSDGVARADTARS